MFVQKALPVRKYLIMKKLLSTLYIRLPDRYLSLDGENIVVQCQGEEIGRLPLHNLEAVVTLGYTGVSPALMGACAERGIEINFLTRSGRFLARVSGKVKGNVFLRRDQYRLADKPEECLLLARNFITGKIHNARWVLERAVRDHPLRVDVSLLREKAASLAEGACQAKLAVNDAELRGIEGRAAATYFSVFNQLILQQKEDFAFAQRSRRPPLDRVNALLSFAYTLLTGMCTGALEAVGLDPYVGFLHCDRPGRASLALDIIEELRPVFADRFVLSLINRKEINEKDFRVKENGAVLLEEEGKKKFLAAWEERKKEVITHPFLQEKISWGSVPYVQSLLLSRLLRGDLAEYPVFFWK